MMIHPNIQLPVEIVFHPSWWHAHEGIVFDKDFYFHPNKRVEEEQHMESALFERWGEYGFGRFHSQPLPVIGPVHIAAGYFVAGLLGCDIQYQPDGSPNITISQPLQSPVDADQAWNSSLFSEFRLLADTLKGRFGYLVGDVDWNGVLNNTLDAYGQDIFITMHDDPEAAKNIFNSVAEVQECLFRYIKHLTGTTSLAVNRSLGNIREPVLLHSECSHTMISSDAYCEFLLPYDIDWSTRYQPFGIHYCGNDLHRFISAYSRIPNLSFLDVGWGSDIASIRRHFPDTFLNIRLSPTEIVNQTPDEIKETITSCVRLASTDYWKVGVCCINLDETVDDHQVSAILQTVFELREQSNWRDL